MKCLTASPCKRALFGGVAAFSMLLLSTPNAFAELGTWAYPNTSTEKAERIQKLSEQLEELDRNRGTQLITRNDTEETLTELLGQLRAAEEALRVQQAPLHGALKKYRQAQEIALSDPMMDIETQRLEYIRIETETADSIKTHQEEVDQINQLVSHATEKLSNARINMDATLHQIENLWRHRENISKIVFLHLSDN